MEQVTFRDFAGAVMGNDRARAAEVLGILLGLAPFAATSAVAHFQKEMSADPSFMAKAMGLRAAVTGGTDGEIAKLLGDCFGIAADDAPPAVATLRKLYPPT